MKRVLVGGGAGGVGEGIVERLLTAGHRVIVPSRSEPRLQGLIARLAARGVRTEGLLTLLGQIGEVDGAERVRAEIEARFGQIDVAIASLGGWWEGARLIDVSLATWHAVLDEMLTTHFVFARTFIPMLLERGGERYIGIGGGAAYLPIRGSSLVSIAAAGQLMFTRLLRAELTAAERRRLEILELVADGPVRTRDSEAIAGPDWITADEVGRVVAELVATGRTADPTVTGEPPILRMRPARRRPPVRAATLSGAEWSQQSDADRI